MAEGHNKSEQVEVSDRGLFDFLGKEEEKEKAQEEVLVTGVENLHVDEAPKVEEKKEEEKKESLLDKLQRTSSSSSSSSDEEEGPDGEKRKKKKGLKEKIKEKLHGDKKEAEEGKIETVVATELDVVVAPAAPPAAEPVEIRDETVKVETAPEEEKKGFLEKIKEKLHGDKKEAEEGKIETVVATEQDVVVAPAAPPAAEPVEIRDETAEVETAPEEEKKGFLEKIKEKLPGHQKEGGEKVVIKESVTASEGGEGLDGKEKKGILGKIMDKLPGFHKEETGTPAGH